MKITAQWIEAAEKRFACSDALKWLRKQPRTVDDLVAKNKFWTVWALGCLADQSKLFEALLAAGADVNGRDEKSLTPLHWSANRGNAKSTRLLIDTGADVNSKDFFGRTALHSVAYWGRATKIISLLLDAGADVNARNSDGWTPLRHAIFLHHADCVKLLEEAGAKL